MDECIDQWQDNCEGAVEMRAVPNGTAVLRCERHFDERMARRQESIEAYADSDARPEWFDPSYAGESWDGE